MGKVWDVLAPRNLELGPLAGSASGQGNWRNWKLARDDNGIAWLVLDKPDSSANVLSEDVLVELDDVLATLERDLPKGVILRSGKPGGFIAGADIHEFSGMTDVAAVETRLTHGNAIVDRLDHLAVPTVAVIHGYCLGGGLEIALACDYRVAVEDARLGFPEVMLGLHPGLGGTVRLPRLINPLEAMTMMLTGRNVRAGRAKSLGLVDAVTTERHVKAAASAAVERQLKTRRGGMLIDIVNSTYGRKLAVKRMRTETAKKAPAAYYPAPYALIEPVGKPRRQSSGHGEGGDRVVRASDGDRHLAQSRARVLPAREAQGAGRRRLDRTACPRHRRRRHGRRHRGLVRVERFHGHACRHEGRAARQGDRARCRALPQDRPQEHRDAQCARPVDPRPQRARACAPPTS